MHALFDGTAKSAAAFAHKALAVNVSDLCAKGAQPMCYVMSLALPPGDFEPWMPDFAAALHTCQKRWGLTLLGGDTVRTQASLSVTITAFGTVPHGAMIQRNGAKRGDAIYVSGTIGDAALGLRLALGDAKTDTWAKHIDPAGRNLLLQANSHPEPGTPLITPLLSFATAAIDVSDGFVRDLGRLLNASGVGAEVSSDAIPLSQAARALVAAGEVSMEDLLTGGDDYQIIACISAKNEKEFCQAATNAGVPMTKVGNTNTANSLNIRDRAGQTIEFAKTGWDHLA